MKIIKAVSQQEFIDIYESNSIFNEVIAFISIIDHLDEFPLNSYVGKFVQAKMWDIKTDLYIDDKIIYKKPEDIELQKIIDFVNQNKEVPIFVVHCHAGISRSGAIAEWLRLKFEDETNTNGFLRQNPHILPNTYILNRLIELDK